MVTWCRRAWSDCFMEPFWTFDRVSSKVEKFITEVKVNGFTSPECRVQLLFWHFLPFKQPFSMGSTLEGSPHLQIISYKSGPQFGTAFYPATQTCHKLFPQDKLFLLQKRHSPVVRKTNTSRSGWPQMYSYSYLLVFQPFFLLQILWELIPPWEGSQKNAYFGCFSWKCTHSTRII